MHGSGQGQVAGPCEHSDEPSGCIKGGEFFDQLSDSLTSQEGFCFMELLSYALPKTHHTPDSEVFL
jgi:hypothetical protein